jgi:DNA gyrase subunit A
VVELKREAMADVVLNQLYRFTPLQTNFPANMLALDSGRPRQMNLKDLLTIFVAFREEVITRRTKYLLGKARDRAHLQAASRLRSPISTRSSASSAPRPIRTRARHADVARLAGTGRRGHDHADRRPPAPDGRPTAPAGCRWSRPRRFLDLRLQRLTALGREEISEELDKLAVEIADYLDILRRARACRRSSRRTRRREGRVRHPRENRHHRAGRRGRGRDLIQREDMVVTGLARRLRQARAALDLSRQRRGGKGRAGMQTRDEDFVSRLFVASTHTPVLFFSSRGQVYKEKVWRLPMARPTRAARR